MPYTPLQLAQAFIQTGELQDALDALNQHLDANPADDDARRLRAQVLMRLRRPEDLATALSDLQQLGTSSTEDRLNLAILLQQSGDYQAASETLAQLHADDPQDERIAERYFWNLMAQPDYKQAAKLLDAMPHTSNWLTKAGDLATEDGHEDEAPAHYTEAIKQLGVEFDLSVDNFARPIHANLLMARAQAYATMGKFHEASEDYAAAQAVMPDDPLIGFWHSFVLAELGHIQEAVVMCRLAMETQNENLKTRMIDNLKALAENPTFAPLVALLDEMG
jgi:tetratricopeptide (TPR) repeat protein